MSGFLDRIQPYAKNAAEQLGIDVNFIMAQWAYETANGTNLGSRKYNNLAGIKYSPSGAGSIGKYQPSDSAHAGYDTLNDFVSDYVRVMKLSYYKDVISTATGENNLDNAILAINKSPYAVQDYNISGFKRYYEQAKTITGTVGSVGKDIKAEFDKIIEENDTKKLVAVGAGALLGLSLLSKIGSKKENA